MSDALLVTVHGSRLYGLHHRDSDYDTYTVVPGKGRTRQRVSGLDDTTRTSYDTFMRACDKGVPQALEAMFSRQASVDAMPWLRLSYRACGPVVRDTYLRTMRSFWESGDFKRRRHACRLRVNFDELEESGRFNPTLSPEMAAWVTEAARAATPPF